MGVPSGAVAGRCIFVMIMGMIFLAVTVGAIRALTLLAGHRKSWIGFDLERDKRAEEVGTEEDGELLVAAHVAYKRGLIAAAQSVCRLCRTAPLYQLTGDLKVNG